MKKKLMLTLATIVAACMMCSVVFASAGIVQNSPVGTGLISNGAINTASFMLREDTDPSAYRVQNGNATYEYDAGWKAAFIVPNTGIPATDLVDGAKITIQFDSYYIDTTCGITAYFSPFNATKGDWSANYMQWVVNQHGNQFSVITAGAQIKIGDSDFRGLVAQEVIDNTGLQWDIITEQQENGRMYATYWLEYDITARTLSVYAGYEDSNVEEKELYCVINNAFTIPDADTVHMNFALDNQWEFDNYKIYRTLNDEVKTYIDVDFSDPSEILKTNSIDAADADKLIIYVDALV